MQDKFITVSSLMQASMEFFANDNEHAFDECPDYLADMTLPNLVGDVAKRDLGGVVGSFGVLGVAGQFASFISIFGFL